LQIRLLGAPVADRKRGAYRALRIVLVRHRGAEDAHHGIADELFHRAASPLKLLAHVSVIGREQSTDVLRIEPFRLRSEADQIDEHDRDGLAFLAERALVALERTCARIAKPRAVRIPLTAARARHHRQSVRRAHSPVTSTQCRGVRVWAARG
jgi:hypothetical protein